MLFIFKSVNTYARHKPGIGKNEQTGNTLTLSETIYKFNEVFLGDTTQNYVFQNIGKPIVARFLEGKNVSIISLGGTGRGKTHTLIACFILF